MMQEQKAVQLLVVWKGKADLIDFAASELKSLLSLHLPWYKVLPVEPVLCNQFSKMLIRKSDFHLLQLVIDRAVLVRTFLFLYSETDQGIEGVLAELRKSDEFLKAHTVSSSDQDQIQPDETYSIQITGEYKTIPEEDQKSQQEAIKGLKFRGTWNPKSATKRFWLIHNHRVNKTTGIAAYERSFFGWEIVKTLQNMKRSFNTQYALSGRAYLGPTTTDHDLAFLMVKEWADQTPSQIISVETVSTETKAQNGQQVNYKTNFEQYGLPVPEVVRMNCCHSMLRENSLDAIVCDPPYGIRATNKVRRPQLEDPVPGLAKQLADDRTPLTETNPLPLETDELDPIILAMYCLAERVLVEGGRLVHLYHISTSDGYWKPFFAKRLKQAGLSLDQKQVPEGVSSIDLLEHLSSGLPPGLQLEGLSHQLLAKDRIRCMVTAKKVSNTNLNNN